jgi:hypothetical protein
MNRRLSDEPPRLLFLHLPKTAGSTLRRIIERQYGEAAWKFTGPTADSLQTWNDLPHQRRHATRALVGHLPYGLHELLPWPVRYMTILREPVDRIISHFAYAARIPASPLSAQVAATGHSLRRYVEETPASQFFNNGQTRLIGSKNLLHAPPADRATLDRAKERLSSSFSVVGLTDRFDETLAIIARDLEWADVATQPPEKVSANRVSVNALPDEDRQVIADHNALDAELYAFARDLFESRAARQQNVGPIPTAPLR